MKDFSAITLEGISRKKSLVQGTRQRACGAEVVDWIKCNSQHDWSSVINAMNILITGGCGYKGSVLVPKLLKRGHDVTVVDAMWFGNYLVPHEKLQVLAIDIRDIEKVPLKGVDCIIHLASVANDPCGDLNPHLTWEVSSLSTMWLADEAVRAGVKQFIYASSASVYGIKEEEQIHEELKLMPISVYNQSKMVAERVLLSYHDQMQVQIVRPATVCGLSPRMRLDIAVNLLTMQALTKKKITVWGGGQFRPNIHVEDITDLYCYLVEHDDIVGIYNAGSENYTVLELAQLIAARTAATIQVESSNDPRSYRLNSDKLKATGFQYKKTVKDAIEEIISAFNDNVLRDEPRHYNVDWMRDHVISSSPSQFRKIAD